MKIPLVSIAVLTLVCFFAHVINMHASDPWGQIVPKSESGPLVWTIDGKEYRIKDTYYVQFPPNLYYYIVYELPKTVDIAHITPGQALELQTPLINHAYKNDLYKRIQGNASPYKDMPVIAIGVSFVSKSIEFTRGYDTNERIEDIKARLSGDHKEASP